MMEVFTIQSICIECSTVYVHWIPCKVMSLLTKLNNKLHWVVVENVCTYSLLRFDLSPFPLQKL